MRYYILQMRKLKIIETNIFVQGYITSKGQHQRSVQYFGILKAQTLHLLYQNKASIVFLKIWGVCTFKEVAMLL